MSTKKKTGRRHGWLTRRIDWVKARWNAHPKISLAFSVVAFISIGALIYLAVQFQSNLTAGKAGPRGTTTEKIDGREILIPDGFKVVDRLHDAAAKYQDREKAKGHWRERLVLILIILILAVLMVDNKPVPTPAPVPAPVTPSPPERSSDGEPEKKTRRPTK